MCSAGATVLPHCQPHIYQADLVTRYIRLGIPDVDCHSVASSSARYQANEPRGFWHDLGIDGAASGIARKIYLAMM